MTEAERPIVPPADLRNFLVAGLFAAMALLSTLCPVTVAHRDGALLAALLFVVPAATAAAMAAGAWLARSRLKGDQGLLLLHSLLLAQGITGLAASGLLIRHYAVPGIGNMNEQALSNVLFLLATLANVGGLLGTNACASLLVRAAWLRRGEILWLIGCLVLWSLGPRWMT